MTTRPPILVVAAAVVDDLARPSRLLAARRTGPGPLAGGWEFPGGKVEPGEAPEDALHRELGEELEIGVRLGAELPAPGGGPWPIRRDLVLRLWFAEITLGVPTPTDSHDALRWLAAAELDTVPWLPADLPILDRLRARLSEPPAP